MDHVVFWGFVFIAILGILYIINMMFPRPPK